VEDRPSEDDEAVEDRDDAAPAAPDDAEVPEADAIEQSTPLGDDRAEEDWSVGDRPEADAIEQERDVPADVDEDRR
jgi:hypothetical protein